MTSQNKTASLSRSVAPIKSVWKSFQIRWAYPGISDLETVSSLPLVKLNPPAKFDDKPYLSKFPLSPGEDLNAPKPMPTSDQLRTSKRFGLLESVAVPMYLSTIEQANAKQDITYLYGRKQADLRFEARQRKLSEQTRGVLCTELEQWVIVDVDVESANGPAPSLHLWAFLQPASIGQNKGPFAIDSSLAPDDFPRSGWAEYKIDPNTKKAVGIDWKNGVSSEVAMPNSDWVCQKLTAPRHGAAATWRFKLKIVVRNQKTSGDVEREKTFVQTKIPEKDFEAGCWLKVWVRDPKAGFSKPPLDDESDAVLQSMDAQSSRGIGLGSDDLFFIGCHGFLRSRILDGTKTASEDAAPPVYVLLFSKEAMEDLIALDKLLKEKGPGPLQMASSTCATAVAALLMGMGLRKILEAWIKETDDAQLKEEKGQFLIELLESYQVANILASYAADGFQNLSPAKATLSASSHQAEYLAILSHLYSQVFDFCLVDNSTHYKKYVEKRLTNRKKALEARIKWTKAHTVRAEAQAKSEDAAKKSRQSEMAKQLEGMGLGLANTAKKMADKKKDKTPNKLIDTANLKLGPIFLVQGKNSWSFPKPFGAPLPIPAVPMVWRVDIGLDGHLSVSFKISPPPEGSSTWEFFVEFQGDGSLTFAAGIHALWSSMDKVMVDDTPKQSEMKEEAQRNKMALRDLRKTALDSSAAPKTEIVRILHSLMKYASLDVAVNASLKAKAVAGCQFTLDMNTGEIGHQWLTTDKQPINAGAEVSVDAHLQFSIVTLDYNLAGMPHLARANPEVLSVDFSGQVLGKTWKVEPKKIDWGSGRIGDKIRRNENADFLVWGRAATFSLEYTDLTNPPIKFELVRTASSAAKPVAPIPDGARKFQESSSPHTCEVTVQLTCQKVAAGALVTAGGWALGDQLKVLGGSHDLGTKTDAGKLVSEIVHGTKANVVLRGSYLESMYRFSQPFYVPTPRLTKNPNVNWVDSPAHQKPSQMQVVVELGYFEDTHIWLQLKNEHGTVVESPNGEAWQCLRIQSPKLTPAGLGGFLLPQFKDYSFRGKAFHIQLSLVPAELGVLTPR